MGDLWRALGYLLTYWRFTLGAFVSLLLVTFRNLGAILSGSLALLAVAGLRDLFTFTQSYWSERASQGAAFDMRNAVFTRLETLSFSYHDRAQTGQLMTRVTSDVD